MGAVAESVQLLGDIVGVLTAQRRVAGGSVAVAHRGVAAGAGGHPGFRIPGAVDFLAQGERIGILLGTCPMARLARVVGGEIGQILVRQGVELPGHLGDLALSGLNVAKLLEQILFTDPGEIGKVGSGAGTLGAVAGRTASSFAWMIPY